MGVGEHLTKALLVPCCYQESSRDNAWAGFHAAAQRAAGQYSRTITGTPPSSVTS
jgi:hypothetical protein